MCGTTEYLPPEIISGGDQNDKVDVWCLGVLLYEMFHKKTPFDGRNVTMLALQQKNANIKFKEGLDNQVKAIIKRCLEFNPNNRATTKELLGFSIFNKILQRKNSPLLQPFKFATEQENVFDVKLDNSKPIQQSMPTFANPNIKKKKLKSTANMMFFDKEFKKKKEVDTQDQGSIRSSNARERKHPMTPTLKRTGLARSVTPVKKVIKYSVNRIDNGTDIRKANPSPSFIPKTNPNTTVLLASPSKRHRDTKKNFYKRSSKVVNNNHKSTPFLAPISQTTNNSMRRGNPVQYPYYQQTQLRSQVSDWYNNRNNSGIPRTQKVIKYSYSRAPTSFKDRDGNGVAPYNYSNTIRTTNLTSLSNQQTAFNNHTSISKTFTPGMERSKSSNLVVHGHKREGVRIIRKPDKINLK